MRTASVVRGRWSAVSFQLVVGGSWAPSAHCPHAREPDTPATTDYVKRDQVDAWGVFSALPLHQAINN
jgi:hypothetical protein